MLSAELLHHHADLRIVDMADTRKQMMLHLVLKTGAQEPAYPARPETHGSRSLDREKIRAVPGFIGRTLRLRRKMSRRQDGVHGVPQQNTSQNIESNNCRHWPEQEWYTDPDEIM